MEANGPLDVGSGYDRGMTVGGLWFKFGWAVCVGTGLDNKEVIDMCCSPPSASCMEGNECRCADGGSLSSSDVGRGSVGDVSPPYPITELVVEDGYE
jgi:hypothetical protein